MPVAPLSCCLNRGLCYSSPHSRRSFHGSKRPQPVDPPALPVPLRRCPAQTPPGDPDEDEVPAAAAPRGTLSHQEREEIEALRTRAEASGFEATSNYEETLGFLRKLQAHFPEMYLGFYGTSGEGRAMPFVVVSREKAFTGRKAQRLGKPVVLIQNGIHAGEIEGKDASLMLLRDLALGRHAEVLDAVTLVVLPIYNVDGHERISPYNRPNQDGPQQGMGFRTTTNGLDLNRDYLKISSEEARSLIALVNDWRPHLHVDDHVTDGIDMDWVLTWSWAEAPQAPAPVDAWLRAHMPAVLAATEKAGSQGGPLRRPRRRATIPPRGSAPGWASRATPPATSRCATGRRSWSRCTPTSPTGSGCWRTATSSARCSTRSPAIPPR